MGAFLADPPQDLDPVEPRHDHIQEHGVRRVLLDDLEPLLPAGSDESLMPLALQDFGDDARHIRLIVDDENPHDWPPYGGDAELVKGAFGRLQSGIPRARRAGAV